MGSSCAKPCACKTELNHRGIQNEDWSTVDTNEMALKKQSKGTADVMERNESSTGTTSQEQKNESVKRSKESKGNTSNSLDYNSGRCMVERVQSQFTYFPLVVKDNNGA